MQRSCLLLRRAAMLSEWKPGVLERNWGWNPRPSTLSAGEYRVASGRGCSGGCLCTLRCGYCRYCGSERALNANILRGWSGCLPFCCLPPSSRCVGLPLQTALGPLLASASPGPVVLQARRTGVVLWLFINNHTTVVGSVGSGWKHCAFVHRFARAELVSGGRVIVGRHTVNPPTVAPGLAWRDADA